MSETVQANDGAMLPLSSLPQQFIYSGGFLSTITVSYAGNTYVQTFTNDGTNIVYISGWVNPAFGSAAVPIVSESGVLMVSETGQLLVTENHL